MIMLKCHLYGTSGGAEQTMLSITQSPPEKLAWKTNSNLLCFPFPRTTNSIIICFNKLHLTDSAFHIPNRKLYNLTLILTRMNETFGTSHLNCVMS